jgi:hypothetical protein
MRVADGNEFAEDWLGELLRLHAAQFGPSGHNRPAVTAALQEVIDEMEA